MDSVIKEYKPSFGVSPFVEFFWIGRFNSAQLPLLSQRVVPNGYIELIIHLTESHCELLQGRDYEKSPDNMLIGLFTRPYDVHFRENVRVFGIRFKPEGLYNVFGVPASEIQSAFADMQHFAGRGFRGFVQKLQDCTSVGRMIRISETYLMESGKRNQLNLYYLHRAAEAIRKNNGLISMDELAGKAYIGIRQLEREFRHKIGMSPKKYMRIARLNAVNRIISKRQRLLLTDISYLLGYSDQAHFIRDFRHFTGVNPGKFIREKGRYLVNPNSAGSSKDLDSP